MLERSLVSRLSFLLAGSMLLSPTFATGQPSPVDLLALSEGTIVLSTSSEYDAEWAALLLLDDTTEHGWSTAEDAPFPHEVVLELPRPAVLSSIAFDNTEAEDRDYPGISAREVEIRVSESSPTDGYTEVLEVELEQGARSEFDLPDGTRARWIKLVVRSNWGHDSYTELMEVDASGRFLGSDEPLPDIEGVYSTNYGPLLFERTGSRVRGCYDWNEGSLTGSVRDRVIQFEWRENGGAQIGTAVMVVSRDGDRINGIWYEDGDLGGLWIGSRAEAGERPDCHPASEDDLERSLTEGGRAILYGIRFDVDADTLRPESTEVLDEVLAVLERRPELRLVIEGHTDATGEDAYNRDLSRRRAGAVVSWLTERGVAAERLEAKGYGETRPAASNETSQGRALNRRVELKRVN